MELPIFLRNVFSTNSLSLVVFYPNSLHVGATGSYVVPSAPRPHTNVFFLSRLSLLSQRNWLLCYLNFRCVWLLSHLGCSSLSHVSVFFFIPTLSPASVGVSSPLCFYDSVNSLASYVVFGAPHPHAPITQSIPLCTLSSPVLLPLVLL